MTRKDILSFQGKLCDLSSSNKDCKTCSHYTLCSLLLELIRSDEVTGEDVQG